MDTGSIIAVIGTAFSSLVVIAGGFYKLGTLTQRVVTLERDAQQATSRSVCVSDMQTACTRVDGIVDRISAIERSQERRE